MTRVPTANIPAMTRQDDLNFWDRIGTLWYVVDVARLHLACQSFQLCDMIDRLELVDTAMRVKWG